MIPCSGTKCKTKLKWSGKGRKPKWCTPCLAKKRREQKAQSAKRTGSHKRGRAASRFGELWLVDGKPIRREARFVWGATGTADAIVESRSGVFHKVGESGLPAEGFTTSHKDLQAALIARTAEARQDPWVKDHPDWWHFESWAHGALSRDITDSVVVHASEVVDKPDEHTPRERCSWCCERRPLVLASEFCSDECMTDYVTTFSAYGLTWERGVSEVRDEGGVAPRCDRADEAVVGGAGARAA